MTLSPELTIAERYTLESRIAVGGMGEVWRARDGVLDRRVAVKVLREEFAADPTFLARFRAEAKHAAGLSHPGVANVYDYGELGPLAYLVMECVDGQPLSTLLATAGRLSPAQTLDIVGQAGLALQAAHDLGVVHRDVKPGNLLVRPDGVVKVTDFGIARVVDAAPVTRTGMVVGTAAYLSPEQAAGRPTTPASDVYALGVVAFECLAGHRPFDGDSPVAVAMAHISAPPPPLPKDTPPLVADLVTAALDKDPARRPRSAGEFGRTALALAATLREPGDVDAAPTSGGGGTGTRLLTAAVPAAAGYDDRERRRLRNIFVAIGAAVVLLGFLLLHSCAGGAQQVTMPSLVGKTFTTASTTLHTLGLNATRRTVHDARHPAGVVLAQSVPPRSRVGTGSSVVLTVASGPSIETVRAADYVGRPVALVTTALRAKGLVVRTVGLPAKTTVGTVLAVSPTGSLREGSTVTLTVATAPTPAPDPHRGPPKHKGDHG